MRKKKIVITSPSSWIPDIENLKKREKAKNEAMTIVFEYDEIAIIKVKTGEDQKTRVTKNISLNDAADIAFVWWRLGYTFGRPANW